jgi:hypothetical protein
VTIEDLVPKVRVKADEPDEVAHLKGDARMALVLAGALADRRQPLRDDLEILAERARVRVPAAQVNDLVATLAARPGPYLAGRTAARARLAALAAAVWRAGELVVDADPTRRLASAPELRAALDRLWPSVSAPALVDDLLTRPDRLAAAAAGVLDPGEQRALLRPPAATLGKVRWTAADLALVDEAR